MGHTVSSQRMRVDRVLLEMQAYAKALRPEDREALAQMIALPLKKVGAISYACSLDVWALCLLTILMEQQKKIARLEHVVDGRISESEQDSALDKNQG